MVISTLSLPADGSRWPISPSRRAGQVKQHRSTVGATQHSTEWGSELEPRPGVEVYDMALGGKASSRVSYVSQDILIDLHDYVIRITTYHSSTNAYKFVFTEVNIHKFTQVGIVSTHVYIYINTEMWIYMHVCVYIYI